MRFPWSNPCPPATPAKIEVQIPKELTDAIRALQSNLHNLEQQNLVLHRLLGQYELAQGLLVKQVKEFEMAVLQRGQAIIDRLNKLSDDAKNGIAQAVATGIANAEANKDTDISDTLGGIENALTTAETTVETSTTPANPAPQGQDTPPAGTQ